MEENIVRYFQVIGHITTKEVISRSQHVQILQEPLSTVRIQGVRNISPAGRNVIYASSNKHINIQLITTFDKVESIINSIKAILEPSVIKDEEWFQIEATRLIPNKKEE